MQAGRPNQQGGFGPSSGMMNQQGSLPARGAVADRSSFALVKGTTKYQLAEGQQLTVGRKDQANPNGKGADIALDVTLV